MRCAIAEAKTTKPPLYISFSAEINPTTSETLVSVVSSHVNDGFKNVHLLLSTPGGHVSAGIMVYNVLRGLPIKLTTHNVGSVNSIGNAIFLAGDKRYACRSSSFMFHGAAITFSQGARCETQHLKEHLDNLSNDESVIADIIRDRTEIEPKKLGSLFEQAAFINPDQAAGHGIIHDIRPVKMNKGSKLIQLVFKR